MSNPKVELHIKDHGVITLELDQDKAPKSVANFLSYVNKGHYSNTVFHRVIPGFMVQGGGFEVGMKQKPTAAKHRPNRAGRTDYLPRCRGRVDATETTRRPVGPRRNNHPATGKRQIRHES